MAYSVQSFPKVENMVIFFGTSRNLVFPFHGLMVSSVTRVWVRSWILLTKSQLAYVFLYKLKVLCSTHKTLAYFSTSVGSFPIFFSIPNDVFCRTMICELFHITIVYNPYNQSRIHITHIKSHNMCGKIIPCLLFVTFKHSPGFY